MRKTSIILAITIIFCSLCIRLQSQRAQAQPVAIGSEYCKDFRWKIVQGINFEERKRQIPAIVAAFSRYTVPERARMLAQLCYSKTEGTLFTPMDLAEIALTETGGHGLSARAVSSRGAVGVWQLMPFRARSHGFTPDDMKNDEKCADAAVRELTSKLVMAKGNLTRAKKLYCGVGPEADAYDVRRRHFRREIMKELENAVSKQAEIELKEVARPS